MKLRVSVPGGRPSYESSVEKLRHFNALYGKSAGDGIQDEERTTAVYIQFFFHFTILEVQTNVGSYLDLPVSAQDSEIKVAFVVEFSLFNLTFGAHHSSRNLHYPLLLAFPRFPMSLLDDVVGIGIARGSLVCQFKGPLPGRGVDLCMY